MKILIVDDSLIQRMVLEHNLKKSHYQVVAAASGKEALRILENQNDVGLVITDIMMPHLSGLELLSLMKSNPQLDSIPVILCTCLSDAENVQKAAQLGGRFYLVKPIQVKVMLEMVQEALADQKPVLREPEESRNRLGMDAAAFYLVMREFEQCVNEKLRLTEQQLESSDTDAIRQDLATLYENAVLLGAERLSGALADIQSGINMSAIAKEDYQTLLKELKALSFTLAKMIADLGSAN